MRDRIPLEQRAPESQLLVNWRKENGYSLNRLCQETGLALSTISLFERREHSKPIPPMIANRLSELGIHFSHNGFEIKEYAKGKKVRTLESRTINRRKYRDPHLLISNAEKHLLKLKECFDIIERSIAKYNEAIDAQTELVQKEMDKLSKMENERNALKGIIEKIKNEEKLP